MLVLLAAWWNEGAVWSQPSAPPPRTPKKREVKSVDDLVRYAKILIERDREKDGHVLGIPGIGGVQGVKRVLLAATTDVDPWVLQAFQRAFSDYNVETITVIQPGRACQTKPEEAVRSRGRVGVVGSESANVSQRDTLDFSFMEKIASQVDKTLNFDARGVPAIDSDLARGYEQFIPKDQMWKARVIRTPFYTRYQLASSWVDYPDDLFRAIGEKVWKKMVAGKKWKLTDEWGSNLEWTVDAKHWEDMPSTRGTSSNEIPNASYVHPNVRPVMSAVPDMKGVLVTRTLSEGPITEIKIFIDKANVTRVEGGGRAGEWFREALQRYGNLQFPGFPGPGVGWVEEVALGTHPKASAALGGVCGLGWGENRRRSGVVHIGIGSTRNRETREALMKGTSGLPRGEHRDFQLAFPTLWIDGEKIIDKGHLTILDDPELRKVAAKYGNPDELLREEWIPEFETGRTEGEQFP